MELKESQLRRHMGEARGWFGLSCLFHSWSGQVQAHPPSPPARVSVRLLPFSLSLPLLPDTSSLTPPQRASLWEGNRLGSLWCLGGLLLIGSEKMILPHSCLQSWAPVTREKSNADSRVELPAETLCQAQTPEVGEDSRALRWERSGGEAMRDPHWSPPVGC